MGRNRGSKNLNPKPESLKLKVNIPVFVDVNPMPDAETVSSD